MIILESLPAIRGSSDAMLISDFIRVKEIAAWQPVGAEILSTMYQAMYFEKGDDS